MGQIDLFAAAATACVTKEQIPFFDSRNI